jgi:hypothetical protein
MLHLWFLIERIKMSKWKHVNDFFLLQQHEPPSWVLHCSHTPMLEVIIIQDHNFYIYHHSHSIMHDSFFGRWLTNGLIGIWRPVGNCWPFHGSSVTSATNLPICKNWQTHQRDRQVILLQWHAHFKNCMQISPI